MRSQLAASRDLDVFQRSTPAVSNGSRDRPSQQSQRSLTSSASAPSVFADDDWLSAQVWVVLADWFLDRRACHRCTDDQLVAAAEDHIRTGGLEHRFEEQQEEEGEEEERSQDGSQRSGEERQEDEEQQQQYGDDDGSAMNGESDSYGDEIQAAEDEPDMLPLPPSQRFQQVQQKQQPQKQQKLPQMKRGRQ